MGLPYLKVSAEDAIKILDSCIIAGYKTKDQINNEYFINTIGVNEGKLSTWRDYSRTWANDCIQKLESVFVSKKEVYNFRDAQPSPYARVNTNVEWNAIVNQLEARIEKLNEYDRYIRNQFNVHVEVIGRDKITQQSDNSNIEIKN